MTFFMIFAIFGYLLVLALLWCLRGFSRELKNGGKAVGFADKVVPHDGNQTRLKRRMEYILRRETNRVGFPPHESASVRRARIISFAQTLQARQQAVSRG